jgi:hypothetical protein
LPRKFDKALLKPHPRFLIFETEEAAIFYLLTGVKNFTIYLYKSQCPTQNKPPPQQQGISYQ